MIGSSITQSLALAAAACITLAGGLRLHARDVVLPESLRIALARYADLDPLAVTWSETTEAAPLGREKMVADVLSRIIGRATVSQLAFRDGRMYVRREPMPGSSGKTVTVEIAFDRNVLYLGDPARVLTNPKERPKLHKWLPGKDQPEAGYFSAEYFRAAGVRLPTRVRELVQAWHPQSELLALLAEGGLVESTGSAELDGRHLIRVQVTALDLSQQRPPINLAALEQRLRAMKVVSEKEIQKQLTDARKSNAARPLQRQYDFYFDPERGYAVRRLDTRDEAGRLLTRSDCTDHEQLSGRNVWLPRLCRVEKYTFVGLRDQVFESPLYVDQYRVSAFDLQPWPYERFELKYTTPGTTVSDGTLPEVKGRDGVNYEVPANSQQLDEVIEAARGKYQLRSNAEKRSGTLRVLFLVLNGVFLGVLAVYFVVRKRKARSA